MIGNYFKTGKTIVIDDEPDQARPLLNSLYKHHIPHYYSNGRPNDDLFPLPKSESQFRLIFMDLNLQLQTTVGEDYKNFKASHAKLIESIVRNINHSYILVIWSLQEEAFEKPYLEIFDTQSDYHTLKKPYSIIKLTKTDYFTEGDDGIWTFIKGKEKMLYEEIEKNLQGLDAFKMFCDWESKINDSAGETIDSILQTVNKYDENNKEENLAKLLTLLSVAYSGDEGFLELSNQKKTDAVLLALNEILHDDVDRLILDKREDEFENWSAKDLSEVKKLRSKFDNGGLVNTKLFTYSPNKPELTGSIYLMNQDREFEMILDESIITDVVKKNQKRKYKDENNNVEPTEEQLEVLTNEFKNQLLENSSPIELNVTPLCDISQGKDKLHRIIPGFIIEEKNLEFFMRKKDFSSRGYISQSFLIDGLIPDLSGNVFLLIDYRFFKSRSKNVLKRRGKNSNELPKYIFTLRSNLINDIQVSLAHHVSRLGVLTL